MAGGRVIKSVAFDVSEIFEIFRPGFDIAAERSLRERAGKPESLDGSDLYPDVRPALSALHKAGLWIEIARNQTERAGHLLRALDLPADMLARASNGGTWSICEPSAAEAPRARGVIVVLGLHVQALAAVDVPLLVVGEIGLGDAPNATAAIPAPAASLLRTFILPPVIKRIPYRFG